MSNIANQFCDLESSKAHVKWTTVDAIWWKISSIAAGNEYLYKYKDSWVIYNNVI